MSDSLDARNPSDEPMTPRVEPAPTRPTHRRHGGRPWGPPNLRGYERAWLSSDVLAGLTLAAVAIPECMGYTKIVGTPVVTGLYTILLPLVGFALIGSSRHLVIGADSATAAILFAGLTGLAVTLTDHWVALTSTAALVAAACLGVAAVLRLGFLSDFLSRTVLVGFLSGVGLSLLFRQLPDMLGISAPSGFPADFVAVVTHLSHAQRPTMIMAGSVIAVIWALDKFARAVPGSLVAIAAAIASTWFFGLDGHGIAIVGHVQAGLPIVRLPVVTLHETMAMLPMCASMFLVIVAQSAATARSFAQKYGEPHDENRDLLALTAANILAGLSSTFVVNGSPTKTAIVDAAGSRTQVAQLTTALIVLATLWFATPLIERLPVSALAALVFLIGIKLIDLRSLRDIYQFRIATFAVAIVTLGAVVWLGVERGIFIAIALSVLDHLRQEYHPKDVVMTAVGSTWKMKRADPGNESEPGLVIYRFEAPLFFANADRFSARVRDLVANAPTPVTWFVIDLVSMDEIDYTGGLALSTTISHLQKQGLTVALASAEDVSSDLDRLGVIDRIGHELVFESVHNALEAYRSAMKR
jgi:high affinity sulfate transporter 1